MGGVALAVLLVISSIFGWQLIDAANYRLNRDSKKTWVTTLIFSVLLVAVGLIMGLAHNLSYGDQDPDGWIKWPFFYCLGIGGLGLLGLVLWGFGEILEGVLRAVRGE